MTRTKKARESLDTTQLFGQIYNKENATIGVDGFLTGKVGRKVSLSLTTTTVSNDTEIYTFSEDGTVLYQITIIYTDGTRELMLSAERTA